jgi:hypothetical protein
MSAVERKFASNGNRIRRSLCLRVVKRVSQESKGTHHERTIESFNCKSSSLRFADVLSRFASSALLTESVSFRSLSCNLCSISCLFFAFKIKQYQRELHGNT